MKSGRDNYYRTHLRDFAILLTEAEPGAVFGGAELRGSAEALAQFEVDLEHVDHFLTRQAA